MSSVPNWKENFTKFLKGRGKIQQLAELTAVRDLQAIAKETQRNREAESAAVRRSLWGDNTVAETDDMGTTILGDINQPPAVVYPPAPQGQNQLGMLLLTAAMAAGIPTAGLVGYALSNRQPAPIVTPDRSGYEDESVSISLGKSEP